MDGWMDGGMDSEGAEKRQRAEEEEEGEAELQRSGGGVSAN